MKIKGRKAPILWRDKSRPGRSRKVLIRHGTDSRALRYADLDLRSTAGKEYRACVEALVAHIGGEPTAPQARLIDMAARLNVLSRLAWDELSRTGAYRDGEPRPAVAAYRSAIADEREVLRTLGLERRAKDIPDLQTYLAQKARAHPSLRIRSEANDDS